MGDRVGSPVGPDVDRMFGLSVGLLVEGIEYGCSVGSGVGLPGMYVVMGKGLGSCLGWHCERESKAQE